MRKTSGPRFDVATITDPGDRAYQQDALVGNFPEGEDMGIGVLADGMGGHSGGDVASALVVGRAFAEIRAALAMEMRESALVGPAMMEAVEVANDAVFARIDADPELRGMGSTLVACVAMGPHLYWVSVGDSPLYLYRDGTLCQLNEDHSMGPRIEAMVASGLMTPEVGAAHPERNQLTSAICGREIERVDCRDAAYPLRTGDVLILASDGLQTLADSEICRLVQRNRRASGAEIAQKLMRGVKDARAPEQDNIAIMVVKVLSDHPAASKDAAPAAAPEAAPRPAPVAAAPDMAATAPATDPLERASTDLEKALAL